MKFTLSWLKEHLETDKSLDEIAEVMTMAGLEIEGIDNPGEALAAFTVAHVTSAEPHPDADKLRVCTVETVDGTKQIVCGAPNARAGMQAIYAPLGAYIPGADFSLDAKPRKIRGVESHGMLCSAKELEAGDDHDGIIDLKGDFPVGTPAAEALGANDPVIDFEVTPNRPDWLGVHGIARDLAAAGLGRLKTAPVTPVEGTFPCPVTVELDWPEACPVFAGRVIRGVKNGPSPAWLQQRLKAIGLRPISRLVDITNLMSHDRCRPLHVYDVAKLDGPIRARRGRGTPDAFEALDGKTYEPTADQCVIADDARCLGFGGVMGGEYSGCTEETTDVFVECAWFDPQITRATGRATGIESDAKHRFERGVDTGFVRGGLELATALILDLCGGEPSEMFVAGEEPAAPDAINFPTGEVKRLTGLDLSNEEIVDILSALGFGIAGAGDSLSVEVPTWRRDCALKADLVEEVARIHGFNRIEAISLPRLPGRREAPATTGQNRARWARRALAQRGYREAVTWSFAEKSRAALFGGHGEGLALENPISSELDVMRPSALIHLLTAIQANADKGVSDPRLFEVGPIYLSDAPDGQETVAAGVRFVKPVRSWHGSREADLFDAKADAMAALDAAGAPVDSLQVAAEARPWWHPGRSGVFKLGPKNVLAEFGEIHPGILRELDIDGRVIGFEVRLDAIPEGRKKSGTKARPPLQRSELMPVRRDFAFVLDRSVAAQDVIRAAKGADKALIADVTVFDVYQGANLGADKVSLALEATLQPSDKTLTDKEIEAVAAKIVAAVEKATGGVLRG
ncbi:phenylalanine--tRNA ligase subunit beta [Hyphobacterium marinum]|uniref:Phenylalanine--tRNA ligase beta subunit n=1 Tax=Hyphobacterium marinum TaxID=3116574 RepID=A0ABU7LUC1_9PROT|nr:phenylalanine--tRNA ligase subunit beta [Hyphobacterium sp. Y6023]MEE2565148.1 phenylalanine--tRNA ligase subunit beta [Hyphobacterium sp. Y6023]